MPALDKRGSVGGLYILRLNAHRTGHAAASAAPSRNRFLAAEAASISCVDLSRSFSWDLKMARLANWDVRRMERLIACSLGRIWFAVVGDLDETEKMTGNVLVWLD